MNNRQILYQTDIQRTGKLLKLGAVSLILTGVTGIIVCLLAGTFPGRLILIVFIAVFVAGALIHFIKISRWNNNQGCYQISIDSIGLHVHSDEPALGESFSIATLNLHQLVQKRINIGEGFEDEYFVEERSGRRHKISTTLANYNLDVMEVFKEIASQFPSVKIIRE